MLQLPKTVYHRNVIRDQRGKLLALSILSSGIALAQAESKFIEVATSPKGSTASAMFHDLGVACKNTAYLLQKQGSGSVENLDALLSNQVGMAFIQLDVLKAREQIDREPKMKEIKQLLPMNFDELHLISTPVQVNKNVFGKITSQRGVKSWSELAGKRLASWGGSTVTAQVMAAKSGIKPQITDYKDRQEAMSALASGRADAVLAVVGQPADWVKALEPARYTLIPIDVEAGKLQGFYRKASIRYPGFGNGGSISTYAVQRILATRDYKTPIRRAMLGRYQACAKAKLTELQETPGFHPKWQEVTLKESDWPWFKP